MSYHQGPLRPAISSEAEALISDFGRAADGAVRGRAKEASNDSLTRDWSKKSALDKYASRVKRATAQYRRDRATLSPTTWRAHEARAYAELQAEQQRAMRELMTGEYWRLAAVRDAPHQEPVEQDKHLDQFNRRADVKEWRRPASGRAALCLGCRL